MRTAVTRPSPVAWPRLLLPGLAVALAGCGAGAPPGAVVSVDTLESGIVLVSSTDLDGDAGTGWRVQEQLRIGVADGADPYVFGSIRAVLLGPDERVYVLDAGARELRIFDAAGRHLRTVGREGGGPGEFRHPFGMAWAPDGNLWVVDGRNQRYAVFTPDGDLVATYARPVVGFSLAWRGGFGPAGDLLEPSLVRDPASGAAGPVLIRHALTEAGPAARDTLALPRDEEQVYWVEFGAGMLRVEVPYAATPTWAFDGRDGIWAGTGERYRLWRQTLDGDTTRFVVLEREPAPVTAEDRETARQGLEELLGGPDGLRRVDLRRIPDRKPAHGPLILDDAGRLWVAQQPRSTLPNMADPRPTIFDVFDPDGRYLGAVPVDVRLAPPPVIAAGRLAGVVADELGVQQVVVYRIRPPAGR